MVHLSIVPTTTLRTISRSTMILKPQTTIWCLSSYSCVKKKKQGTKMSQIALHAGLTFHYS